MDLLNRYVNEVGKNLPRNNRADIESEIHSTLQDMLEDRSQKTGQPVDDAMIMTVLREYGAPKTVAATYQPEHYLIGPKLYPIFLLVLKIVFIVLTVTSAIGVGVSLGTGQASVGNTGAVLGKAALEYLQGLMAAFGNIVFVFAVLDRFLPVDKVNIETKWDPADLLKEPDANAVRLWEPVFIILVEFAALVVLNFYPQVISISYNPFSGGPAPIPLLSAAFFSVLPWINLLLVLEIILNVVLLRMGSWTAATRAAYIALKIFGVAIAVILLKGPSIVGLTPQSLTAWQINSSQAQALVQLVNLAANLGLVIAVVAGTFDVIKGLYHLILRQPQIPSLRIR